MGEAEARSTYNETGEQRSQITTSTDGVGGDVGSELSEDERSADEPYTKSSGMAGFSVEELAEKVDR